MCIPLPLAAFVRAAYLPTVAMAAEWSDVFDPDRLPPGLAPLLEDDLPSGADGGGGGALPLPPFLSTPPFRDPLVDVLAVPADRGSAADWAAAASVPAGPTPVTTVDDADAVARVGAVLPSAATAAVESAVPSATVPMPVVAAVPVPVAPAVPVPVPTADQLRVAAPRLGVATPPAVGAVGAGGRATKKRRPPAPSALQLAAAQADAVRERFKAANKAAAAAAAAAKPVAAPGAVVVGGARRGVSRVGGGGGGPSVGDGGAAAGAAASTATSAATADAGAGAVPSYASSVSGGDGGAGRGRASGAAAADGDATNAAKYERRLKMNRASAAASRLRHKTYIGALEASVKAATAMNEEMVTRLQQAWEENAALKARLEVVLAEGRTAPPPPPPPPRAVLPPGVVGRGAGAPRGGGGSPPDDPPPGGLGASCFS